MGPGSGSPGSLPHRTRDSVAVRDGSSQHPSHDSMMIMTLTLESCHRVTSPWRHWHVTMPSRVIPGPVGSRAGPGGGRHGRHREAESEAAAPSPRLSLPLSDSARESGGGWSRRRVRVTRAVMSPGWGRRPGPQRPRPQPGRRRTPCEPRYPSPTGRVTGACQSRLVTVSQCPSPRHSRSHVVSRAAPSHW